MPRRDSRTDSRDGDRSHRSSRRNSRDTQQNGHAATAAGAEPPPKSSMYLTFDYTWTITVDNMSRFAECRTGDCMKSPKFVTRCNGQFYTWQIELYPTGFHKDHAGHMSLFLVLVGGSKATVRGNYVVDVVDRNLEKKHSEISNETDFFLEEGVGHSRYIKMDLREMRAKGILQNSNNLVFDYQINLQATAFKSETSANADENGYETTRTREPTPPHVPPERMDKFKEIERPRMNGHRDEDRRGYDRDRGGDMFYDIRIVAGDGGRFYCHSSEMAHASDVLRDISEQAEGGSMNEADGILEIEIEGVPTGSVREVLRFVYCGQAQLVQQYPLDIPGICNVAEQWNLQGLLDQCEQHLTMNLRPETSVDAFLCGVDYGMASLKARGAVEILTHMQAAIKSENWHKLASRPKLVTALFSAGPIHEAAYIGITKPKSASGNRPQSKDDRREKPRTRDRDRDKEDERARERRREKERRERGRLGDGTEKTRVGRMVYSRAGR